MTEIKHDYIPAAGLASLAPLYDPLMRLVMREAKFKSRLIAQSRLPSNGAVLDLGCGTATLTLMIKSVQPELSVSGLDGDARILAIARRKIEKSGLAVQLVQAYSFDLPYPAGTFQRVLTSLTLHHLSSSNLDQTLWETWRVLAPGGELHIADFAGGHRQLGHLRSHFNGHRSEVREASPSLLGAKMAETGFHSVQQHGDITTLLGRISYFSAKKGNMENLLPLA